MQCNLMFFMPIVCLYAVYMTVLTLTVTVAVYEDYLFFYFIMRIVHKVH